VQEGWSWRELLGGMERRDSGAPSPAPTPPPDADFDQIDARMSAEITAMGIDAAAILGRSRLEEATVSLLGDDPDGARLVVRRVAPAAVRRLSRRLLTDAALRQQANDFVQAYARQVHIARMAGDARTAIGDLLNSDAGRAYLLFDATLTDVI
jgi:hypothetical protein